MSIKTFSLDDEIARFEHRPLRQSVFLNSVPKCGTHLLRNTMRMFVPAAQQYHSDFIQLPNLGKHLRAFNGEAKWISWGHLLFTDDSAIATRDVRHLLLVRDPYDFVLARTRFFLSDELQHPMNHIKGGAARVEQVMNMLIMGVYQRMPSLKEAFDLNAVAWMGAGVSILKMEDLVAAVKTLETEAAEAYFRRLFDLCGIDPVPEDWRERVRIGSDPRHSRTARENLTVGVEVPRTLPQAQRDLVDYTAPGLRALLGYA